MERHNANLASQNQETYSVSALRDKLLKELGHSFGSKTNTPPVTETHSTCASEGSSGDRTEARGLAGTRPPPHGSASANQTCLTQSSHPSNQIWRHSRKSMSSADAVAALETFESTATEKRSMEHRTIAPEKAKKWTPPLIKTDSTSANLDTASRSPLSDCSQKTVCSQRTSNQSFVTKGLCPDCSKSWTHFHPIENRAASVEKETQTTDSLEELPPSDEGLLRTKKTREEIVRNISHPQKINFKESSHPTQQAGFSGALPKHTTSRRTGSPCHASVTPPADALWVKYIGHLCLWDPRIKTCRGYRQLTAQLRDIIPHPECLSQQELRICAKKYPSSYTVEQLKTFLCMIKKGEEYALLKDHKKNVSVSCQARPSLNSPATCSPVQARTQKRMESPLPTPKASETLDDVSSRNLPTIAETQELFTGHTSRNPKLDTLIRDRSSGTPKRGTRSAPNSPAVLSRQKERITSLAKPKLRPRLNKASQLRVQAFQEKNVTTNLYNKSCFL